MSPRFISMVLAGAFATATGLARADDAAVPGTGFNASRYEELWTKSPFAVASSQEADVSPDYSLVGIARIDGVFYASLIDKQSNEHFLLTSDAPVRGLKLVSITPGHDAASSTAVMQRNGESLTLKLEAAATPPPAPAPNMPQAGNQGVPPMPNPNGIQSPNSRYYPAGGPNGMGGGQRPPQVMMRHPIISVPPPPH